MFCLKLFIKLILFISLLLSITSTVQSQSKGKVLFVKDKNIDTTGHLSRVKRQETPPEVTSEKDIFEIEDTVDPFARNKKWSRFIKVVEGIAVGATNLMKNYSSTLNLLWSEKNPPYAENKILYLQNFSSSFATEFNSVKEFFNPIHEKLEHGAAHTRIDPLIDLQTISAAIDLAMKNSPKMRDMTRLKWIEINAMATTVHHIFDRLSNLFVVDGLVGINDVVQILYPSWFTKAAIKENEDTFESMNVEHMVNYIDAEMIGFGEKYHLIRGLERILRKKVKEWNPRETEYNFYCYGNNEYGIILDQFDLITDAALYLSLADIKFTLIQMIREVSTQLIQRRDSKMNTTDENTSVDFSTKFDEFLKNMNIRIDKKIKFMAINTDDSDKEVIPGPIIFKCDRPPENNFTKGQPMLSAPNCPPGVFVQNGELYQNETKLDLPKDANAKVLLPDGKEINCIRLELVAVNSNGTIVFHKIKDGVCVDGNDTAILDCQVKTLPVVVDEAGIPVIREIEPLYPKPPSEWGKTIPPDTLSPLANGTQPPLDPQGGPPKVSDTNPGYLDPRTPIFDSTTVAQFSGAFGGYLESELVLSPDGSCAGTCMDYHRPTKTCTNKTTHCELYRKSHCEPGKECMKQASCPTSARRCIRTARQVSICPAQPNSGKLYDWINMNGKEVGSSGACAGGGTGNASEVIDPTKTKCDEGMMVAKERWEMEGGVILNTPQYCELCLCVCDDPLTKEGHHSFDLSPSVSDVSKGYVVTGVKFVQTKQMMRLIIEEGQLVDGEQGRVEASTLKWEVIEKDSSPSSSVANLGSTGFKKINLDIVHGMVNEVVSGVRFRLEDDRLELDVQFVKIDKSGIIIPPVITWRSPNWPVPTVPRRKVNLQDACSPWTQSGPSQPFNLPENAEFIEFDASSLEKDAGQSVIPFFDLQPVQHPDSNHERPLTALGILYKSKRNFGGFIAPTVTIWEKSYLEQ